MKLRCAWCYKKISDMLYITRSKDKTIPLCSTCASEYGIETLETFVKEESGVWMRVENSSESLTRQLN